MRKNPVLVVYPAYANETQLVVSGHLLKEMPKRWFPESKRWWRNMKTMIKLFMLKGIEQEEIQLHFSSENYQTITDKRGYFHFVVPHKQLFSPGQHEFIVKWLPSGEDYAAHLKAEVTGTLIRPSVKTPAVITDVDDTLMISHSRTLVKKLITLLTKRPDQRHVFNDVARHYSLLNRSFEAYTEGVSFFAYVSSSEWNLYPFIHEVCRINNLPRGVFLLRRLKVGLRDLLRTGAGSHAHKLRKIGKLLMFYQEMSFVLLGDDNQQDPEIYRRIARLFPEQVSCIYIRNARKSKRASVIELSARLNSEGIHCFYYKNSSEAIQHSIEIGLIKEAAAEIKAEK